MDKTATEKSTGLLSLYDKTKKYADIAYRSGLLFFLASMAMSFTRLTVFQVTYTLQILGTILLIIVAVYKVFFEFFRNWKNAIFALLIIVFGFVCYYIKQTMQCRLRPESKKNIYNLTQKLSLSYSTKQKTYLFSFY